MNNSNENRASLAEIQKAIEAERQSIIENLTTPTSGDQYSSTALLVANRARREWEAVALKWRDKNRELEREVREMQQLLELLHAAEMRAVNRWRMCHPGRECVWPERGELLAWLMDQLQLQDEAHVEAHVESAHV